MWLSNPWLWLAVQNILSQTNRKNSKIKPCTQILDDKQTQCHNVKRLTSCRIAPTFRNKHTRTKQNHAAQVCSITYGTSTQAAVKPTDNEQHMHVTIKHCECRAKCARSWRYPQIQSTLGLQLNWKQSTQIRHALRHHNHTLHLEINEQ